MTAAAGYTPGSLYKRHANIGYSPGSHYQRFGNFGLMQSKNMQSMNQQAAASYNAAMTGAGPGVFEANQVASEELSELAVQELLNRVQAVAKQLSANQSSLGLGTAAVDESA